MAGWSARAGGVVLFLLLSAFAIEPLSRASFTAPELRALAEARGAWSDPPPGGGSGSRQSLAGSAGHPLARLSLSLSSTLWSRQGAWAGESALPLRLENLLLIWVAAAGLWFLLRRLLLPWMGRDSAGSAGLAAGVCFALHPAVLPAATSVTARGDLLALALGLAAGAVLMRGRQERRPELGLLAGVLAILAGFASDLALALPPLLAVAEFSSARRWRPERVRWRTALITLAALAACVGVQTVVRSVHFGRIELFGAGSRLAQLHDGHAWAGELLRLLERIGVLLLPVPTSVTGPAGLALAGALLLVALHPGWQAARSAPRLWGWMLLGWSGALALCEALSAGARVTNADWTWAGTLAGSAAVVAAGLGTAMTALSGPVRAWLPWVAAVCLALLGHALALAWRDAGAQVERLRVDLEAARERFGRDARLIVIDPPGLVRGVDALAGELPALLDPRSTGRSSDPRPAFARGVSRPAFLALCREPELSELRRGTAVVSFPRAAIEPEASGRLAVRLPAPRPSDRVRSWQHEGRSPPLDLEALAESALRVRATPEADVDQAPRMQWRASAPLDSLRGGTLRGVWRAAGEQAGEPLALFDLSSSLAWLLGDRILQIFPPEGWGFIVEADVSPRIPEPAPGIAPEVVDLGDWRFPVPAGGFPRDEQGRERWILGLLDLGSWRHVEIDCALEVDGSLLAPGAARTAADWLRQGGGPVGWSLDGRIDGVTVWRSSGRRVASEPR